MYKDYASPVEAQLGLIAKGIMDMPVELVPVLGGRFQPIVICEREADAEHVMGLGFNAKMTREYAVD